ncbi:MAG: ACT domain-containing protein, partial [Mesorhizobium sp.]
TLNIHSSLEAVGFLAAITTRLAAAEIGVNPVSAFYHDHLFVPVDRAEEAIDVLRRLAEENRGVTTFPP